MNWIYADRLFQAYELSVLTGTQVLLLVVSETGLVYTFTTPKLQPLVTKAEGKNLIQVCFRCGSCTLPSIPHLGMGNLGPFLVLSLANCDLQACLNAPEPTSAGDNGVDDPNQVESPEESGSSHLASQQTRGMPQNAHMPPSYMPNVAMDPQAQALAYSNYVQRNNQYMAPHSGHQS